jgi:AraC-like DNA-binding protein
LTDPQLDAASIAERQHISRRRLDEIFLAELQQTVAARIRVRRLERAAATLSDEESIISVAYKVGFEDAANFTRAFKRHFGVTPREYRRAQLHKRQL